jgi:hypothetical protein
MDGMSITNERKKEIGFTKPFAVPGTAFLAAKDSQLAKTRGAGALIDLDKDPAAGDAAIKSVQTALKGKTPKSDSKQLTRASITGAGMQPHILRCGSRAGRLPLAR